MNIGAINKNNDKYVLPEQAIKIEQYYCPSCKKDLILCKGNIKIAHFRHKIDNINPCEFYTSPNESQIHKDAKYKLREILKNHNLIIHNKCFNCGFMKQYFINKNDIITINLEYRFYFNNKLKIADLTCLNNNSDINYIFEIYHSHKTNEFERPEPWFEFDASCVIQTFNNTYNKIENIDIQCIRAYKCQKCKNSNNNCQLENEIRTKLGQDIHNSIFYSTDEIYKYFDTIQSNDDLETKYLEYYRPQHLRIDMTGNRDDNDIIYPSNKQICELFDYISNKYCFVIYCWKGLSYAFIVLKKNYIKFDYWNKKYWYCCDGKLKLPYISMLEFCGGVDGTVNIIKCIIKQIKTLK